MDNRTDNELILAARDGDDAAFRELMMRHMKAALDFARQYSKDADALEDIVQDSFFKVWKHLKKFDADRPFKPWLFSIVRNTALDHLKKIRSTAFSELDDPERDESFADSLESNEPTQSESFEAAEIELEVIESMNDLHPDHRAVLVMHYRDEMTFEDIAQVMKKPVNTVKSWHRRALIKMRPRLAHRK